MACAYEYIYILSYDPEDRDTTNHCCWDCVLVSPAGAPRLSVSSICVKVDGFFTGRGDRYYYGRFRNIRFFSSSRKDVCYIILINRVLAS